MRRFSSTNTASWVGTRFASFGAAVTEAEINQATKTTGTTTTLRAAEASWASVDIIRRQRHASLAASVTAAPLYDIRAAVAAGNAAAAPVADVKAQFTKGDFKNIDAMVTAYEVAMLPVRKLYTESENLQVDVYGLNDNIKLGLNLFSQEVVDEKKKTLVVTKEKMAKARAEIKAIMEKNFTTGIYNDMSNVLRIAGATQEHARDLGMRVMDDMSLFGIPLDSDSQMLLKNLTFGDTPQEDSNLLFTYCEFPERGDVSISDNSLEMIADSALKTIADRHQTPLTDTDDENGKLLRMGETLPLLQRSSD